MNERCTLECAPNHYYVRGDYSRQCQANEEWNGAELICAPFCPNLAASADSGEVVVSGVCSKARDQDSCTTSCVDNAWEDDQTGEETSVCLIDGTWSPKPLNCIAKATCSDREITAASRNATTVSGQCAGTVYSSNMEGILAGLSCTQACRPIYWEDNGEGATSATCLQNGSWTSAPLSCQPIPVCTEDLSATADFRNVTFDSGSARDHCFQAISTVFSVGSSVLKSARALTTKWPREAQCERVSKMALGLGTRSLVALFKRVMRISVQPRARGMQHSNRVLAMEMPFLASRAPKSARALTTKWPREAQCERVSKMALGLGTRSLVALFKRVMRISVQPRARGMQHSNRVLAMEMPFLASRAPKSARALTTKWPREAQCERVSKMALGLGTRSLVALFKRVMRISVQPRARGMQHSNRVLAMEMPFLASRAPKSARALTTKWPSGSAVRTCQQNGSWSGDALACRPVQTCDENISATASARNATFKSGSCDGNALPGISCIETCADSYIQISGNAIRVCGSSGVWSGEALECALPPSCPNATASFSSRNTTLEFHSTVSAVRVAEGQICTASSFTYLGQFLSPTACAKECYEHASCKTFNFVDGGPEYGNATV